MANNHIYEAIADVVTDVGVVPDTILVPDTPIYDNEREVSFDVEGQRITLFYWHYGSYGDPTWVTWTLDIGGVAAGVHLRVDNVVDAGPVATRRALADAVRDIPNAVSGYSTKDAMDYQ